MIPFPIITFTIKSVSKSGILGIVPSPVIVNVPSAVNSQEILSVIIPLPKAKAMSNIPNIQIRTKIIIAFFTRLTPLEILKHLSVCIENVGHVFHFLKTS